MIDQMKEQDMLHKALDVENFSSHRLKVEKFILAIGWSLVDKKTIKMDAISPILKYQMRHPSFKTESYLSTIWSKSSHINFLLHDEEEWSGAVLAQPMKRPPPLKRRRFQNKVESVLPAFFCPFLETNPTLPVTKEPLPQHIHDGHSILRLINCFPSTRFPSDGRRHCCCHQLYIF